MAGGLLKKPKDTLSGALFLVVGLAVLWFAQDYNFGTSRQMGAGYFPTLLAGSLVFFSIILIVRSLFGEAEHLEPVSIKPLISVLGGSLLFALMLRPFGLILAIIPVVLLCAWADSQIRPLGVVVLALVLSLGSTVLFVYALGQPIPIVGYIFG
jgi:hypothetical protein